VAHAGAVEQQLGIARARGKALLARLPRFRVLLEPSVRTAEQRVGLPQVRLAGLRQLDALPQVPHGRLGIAGVVGRHPQVEVDEGVIRVLLQVEPQQAHVALALPLLPLGRGVVAGVSDEGIGVGHLLPEAPHAGQDLLVHAELEPQVRVVPEELHVVDDLDAGLLARARQAVHTDGVCEDVLARLLDQLSQARAVALVDHVIGVHPEDPLACGVAERLVPRRREAVAPGEVLHPRPASQGELLRAVLRARIDNDHLVDPRPNAVETLGDVPLLVADDHAQRDARRALAASGLRRLGPHFKVPLGPEALEVALQQPLGVDALADECPAAEMVHERILRDEQPVASGTHAHGEVIILEGPDAEGLIQQADTLESGALDEQAEADEPNGLGGAAAVPPRQPGSEGGELARFGVGHIQELIADHVVAVGTDHAHIVGALGASRQAIEPALGHQRVVVEQDDVVAGGGLDALVHALREAQVLLVADHLGPGHRGQVLGCAVDGPVVDEDELIRLRRVCLHALDAHTRVGDLVP